MKKFLVLIGISCLFVGVVIAATISSLQINGDLIVLGKIISSNGTNGLGNQLLGLSSDAKKMQYYTPTLETRSGNIILTTNDILKVVNFSSNLPSANYEVFFQAQSNTTNIQFWASLKTTGGFTINLSSTNNMTVSYVAIQDQ